MKGRVSVFVAGFALALVLGYVYSDCRAGKWEREAEQWKIDWTILKAANDKMVLESDQKIEALLEQIGGLQGNVDSLVFANAKLEERILEAEQESAVLEEQYVQMKEEVQPVLDANPKVAALVFNLEAQGREKDRIVFTLRAQKENDRAIILNLTERCELEAAIASQYKAQLNWTRELLGKSEMRVSILDKRVLSLERQAAWPKIGTIGLGLAFVAALIF